MQLSEIRINLCGPISQDPSPQPRLATDGQGPMLSSGTHFRQNHSAPLPRGGRLRAFCSLTFDNTFVVRDVKLIEGNDGLFLAMPSRKLCDRCRRCGEKNHLRARFCNQCGSRLDENRHMGRGGNGSSNGFGNNRGLVRMKLHADIAHPINADCRLELERRVLMAYLDELERSKEPGYVPPNLEGDYTDFDDHHEVHPVPPSIHLRPTGTEAH